MMNQLQVEALKIRNDAIRPMLLAKEIDCWTALAMVVDPSEELKEASLVAALKLMAANGKPSRIKVKKEVVTIEELASHAV